MSRLLDFWRIPYSPANARRLGRSVPALRRAPLSVRGLLSVPPALAAWVLTFTGAFLVLINVLAYPFRPYLHIPGDTSTNTADIWTRGYADSWGGPTLAGAWLVHGLGVLVLLMPPLLWAVRWLIGVQLRLVGLADTPVRTGSPQNHKPARSQKTALPRETVRSDGPVVVRRVGAVVGAVGSLFGFSLAAHQLGIGDNVLWLPRTAVDTIALIVTVAPVAALLVAIRSPWWRGRPQM